MERSTSVPRPGPALLSANAGVQPVVAAHPATPLEAPTQTFAANGGQTAPVQPFASRIPVPPATAAYAETMLNRDDVPVNQRRMESAARMNANRAAAGNAPRTRATQLPSPPAAARARNANTRALSRTEANIVRAIAHFIRILYYPLDVSLIVCSRPFLSSTDKQYRFTIRTTSQTNLF